VSLDAEDVEPFNEILEVAFNEFNKKPHQRRFERITHVFVKLGFNPRDSEAGK